jgi:hypothetical protein
VFISYTSEHYGKSEEDGIALLSMAILAAVRFFRDYYGIRADGDENLALLDLGDWDLNQNRAAFWLARGCLCSSTQVDEDGAVRKLDPEALDYETELKRLGNEDVSTSSTIDKTF